MPLDTVRLKSAYMSTATVRRIEAQGERMMKIDCGTGEITWERTTTPLRGSWDSRISIMPMFEEWTLGRSGKPELHPSQPYLIVECSIAKVFYGQNIYGGPEDFEGSVTLLIALLEKLLGVRLPAARLWHVCRVDWAECFALPYQAIQEWFEGLRNCTFPRRDRKAQKHGTHSIHFGGETTAFKAYHKGAEFAEHDAAKVKRAFSNLRVQQYPQGEFAAENARFADRKTRALQRLANNRLRLEVGVHKEKLEYDFGHVPRVHEVTADYLKRTYDREVSRFLKEGQSMHIVREAKAVDQRLHESYGARLAGTLYGLWTKLATMGEVSTMQKYARRSFYRHRKYLKDAGISWLHTDVQLIARQGVLPIDFSPIRANPRRCTTQVREKPVFLLAHGLSKLAA